MTFCGDAVSSGAERCDAMRGANRPVADCGCRRERRGLAVATGYRNHPRLETYERTEVLKGGGSDRQQGWKAVGASLRSENDLAWVGPKPEGSWFERRPRGASWAPNPEGGGGHAAAGPEGAPETTSERRAVAMRGVAMRGVGMRAVAQGCDS